MLKMYMKYKLSSQSENGEQIKPTSSNSENEDVLKCWHTVDAQDNGYQDWHPPPSKPPGILGWRTVRIFVSSTFSDFFSEREILVKKVFPEIREWGSERKIRVIDCDLRWGVPHDSTTGETIAVCMEELDQCHDTNEGEPFFLNLMGERYGWIPSIQENTEDVREEYDWVDGTSITFMEILHGAYRRKNPNAVFFLRNSDFLSDIPESHINKFVEGLDIGKEHLKILKVKLRERFPDQVFEYNVKVEGVSQSTGTERVQLTNLDEFADRCTEFFKAAIARKYPRQQTVTDMSVEEQEQELQRIYIVEKAELVIGREQQVERLLGYIKDPRSCDLEKIVGEEARLCKSEVWSSTPEDNLLCVVQAKSGWGKTSLLAHMVLKAIEVGHNIFYHFCGSTSHSRRTSELISRLCNALSQDVKVNDEEGTEEIGSTQERQQKRLRKAFDKFRSSDQVITVVIDAVNELDLSNMVDHLSWLPTSIPSNVKVIISCNEHAPTLARLREHPCYWLTVGELDDSHMRSLAVSYLGRYNKRLDSVQLAALTQTKVNSPLWMTLICEELRVFGDFRTVTQKIQTLPDTLDGLFGIIFNRLLAEDETGYIRKTLCLIACSFSGMPTEDVLKLLGDVKIKEEAAPIHWAVVRRHLKPYLRTAGFPDEYVTFSHEKIWKAVEDHVITSPDERNKWQLHLADFYDSWSTNSNQRMSLLPDLLRNTRQQDRLVKFMREDPDSGRIGQFKRSDLLKWCRCTRPVHGSWSHTPVIICTFCSYKTRCFNPINHHQAKDSCVICGTYCFPSTSSSLASLCSFHAKTPPNVTKCIICTRMVHLKTKQASDVQGKLCQQCGFGTHGKMCAHVGAM